MPAQEFSGAEQDSQLLSALRHRTRLLSTDSPGIESRKYNLIYLGLYINLRQQPFNIHGGVGFLEKNMGDVILAPKKIEAVEFFFSTHEREIVETICHMI